VRVGAEGVYKWSRKGRGSCKLRVSEGVSLYGKSTQRAPEALADEDARVHCGRRNKKKQKNTSKAGHRPLL
jgi:hypothetical protein